MSNDETFLIGLKSGNKKVFDELFEAYYVPLCNYCIRYVNDRDIAEELVQDLFYRLWVKRDELSINSSLKSYLYAALRNQAFNYLNQSKIQDKYTSYVITQDTTNQGFPDEILVKEELEERINQAINLLPQKRKRIFELSRYEGKKNKEIALLLNISVKTVENQMTKALEQLKSFLKDFL